ncbi:MAG: bifunctional O-acetylhomoserine aminocarboxypropyltransferase/cysteine synthase, partial [Woeseiaceae bacterium]|nr:bifunctional O-acetylhomoserine aminocarboxypropyltransferase/cysteine synthase [Woeseiaceae bacterium]NIP20871.1 bifunctional O-acetylhomoserine aminocarboxypropyltransferase/cysteine synthase [Woeseiaceae bacterium]
ISPFNAFLLAQGVETLPLRMRQHVANAAEIAIFLEEDQRVISVSYGGLEASKYRSLADKYLPNGCGAVFCFELSGGREAGLRFIETLSLFS